MKLYQLVAGRRKGNATYKKTTRTKGTASRAIRAPSPAPLLLADAVAEAEGEAEAEMTKVASDGLATVLDAIATTAVTETPASETEENVDAFMHVNIQSKQIA